VSKRWEILREENLTNQRENGKALKKRSTERWPRNLRKTVDGSKEKREAG